MDAEHQIGVTSHQTKLDSAAAFTGAALESERDDTMNAAARDSAPSGEGFSLEDVNRRLPLVRAIMADVLTLHRDLVERRERLAQVRRIPGKKKTAETNVYEEELREIELGIEQDEAQLDAYIDELDELGGILRDADTGCVEFAGLMDGRPVLWGIDFTDGESSYWRDSHSDYDERHALLEPTVPQDHDNN